MSLLSRRHLPNLGGVKNKGRNVALTEAEIGDQNAGKNVTILLGICAIIVVVVILFRLQSTTSSGSLLGSEKLLVEDEEYIPKNDYSEEDLARNVVARTNEQAFQSLKRIKTRAEKCSKYRR